jgi:hypothetical protein
MPKAAILLHSVLLTIQRINTDSEVPAAKFMTTIAAMQCVEKGLLSLDEDVTLVLPELKGREVLKGFEEGSQKPILVPNTKKITLRSVSPKLSSQREKGGVNHVTDIC